MSVTLITAIPAIIRPLPQKGFFGQTRVTFYGIQEAASLKPGIRCHNFITALFIRIFFAKKIIDVRDLNGKVYYLNRGSLINWIRANDAYLGTFKKTSFNSVTNNGIKGQLTEILGKKSPKVFSPVAWAQFELNSFIKLKQNQVLNGSNSIATLAAEARCIVRQTKLAGLRPELQKLMS